MQKRRPWPLAADARGSSWDVVILGTFLALCFPLAVTSFLVDNDGQPCGKPAVSPSTARIVGGHPSLEGALPWTVMLVWCGFFRCGGAIVGPNVILTAAHCFDEPRVSCYKLHSRETRYPSNWTVYAGKMNAIRRNEEEQELRVSQILIHPFYDNVSLTYDVALLRLEKNVTWGKLARPVCLPDGGTPLVPGKPCIVAGYGETLAAQTFTLNQATVHVISSRVCEQPDWYGLGFLFPPEQFCAGYKEGGKDACDGDSGSPLVCEFNGRWYASGVVSRGLGCAVPRRPGIYTNVSFHRDWILSAMRLGPLQDEYPKVG